MKHLSVICMAFVLLCSTAFVLTAESADDAFFWDDSAFFTDSGFDDFGFDTGDDAFFWDDSVFFGEGESDDFGFADISFGEDDVLFSAGDDDWFGDDSGIEVFDESAVTSAEAAASAAAVFNAGSIKIGGSFSSSVSSSMVLYADNDDSFGKRFENATITPALSGTVSIDARPTDSLRMYMKMALSYPFVSTGIVPMGTSISLTPANPMNPLAPQTLLSPLPVTISNFFSIKEMFTDFSVKDRAFFRFGLHTVSWGTGYFFSPVSDIINTSSIDPQNTSEQVNGSLNLRTQVIFPGSQNCLWLYAIPSVGKLEDSALAGKADIVIGGCELSTGMYWKYKSAPKAMLTVSASVFKNVSVFGEAVYEYGAASEWNANDSFKDKTSIFKATAGFSYYWKEPKIMMAGQYFYDGNNKDDLLNIQEIRIPSLTYGHNAAFMVSFGEIPFLDKVSASIFAMANFGRDDIPAPALNMLGTLGIPDSFLSSATVTATMNYSPTDNISFGAGTVLTWKDYDSKPEVSVRLSATLGGGKF